MGGVRWGGGWAPVPGNKNHYFNGVGSLFSSSFLIMKFGGRRKCKP